MARADARLKNLPREALDELWDLRHPPDTDGQALTLVEIAAGMPQRYGVEIGKSALAEFYSWLKVQRRMWKREGVIDQMKEIIAVDSSLSPEQVKAAGQRLFMADGILENDVRMFATAANLQNDDVRLRQKDAELGLRKQTVDVLKRRVALLEKKAARLDELEAKAREIRSAGGLSDETLDMLEKQLKLL